MQSLKALQYRIGINDCNILQIQCILFQPCCLSANLGDIRRLHQSFWTNRKSTLQAYLRSPSSELQDCPECVPYARSGIGANGLCRKYLFPSLDFNGAYWQLPLSVKYHSFMTPNGIINLLIQCKVLEIQLENFSLGSSSVLHP